MHHHHKARLRHHDHHEEPGEFRGQRSRRGRTGARHGRSRPQGDLRVFLLQLIAEPPRPGFELIKAVEDRFGVANSQSPESIETPHIMCTLAKLRRALRKRLSQSELPDDRLRAISAAIEAASASIARA